MLHLGLLQSLKYSHMSQIYSGLPRCHDSLSSKNEIIQTGESSSLIFYLIYIVCQIPMVEMFATNMSHKLPFCVASPGCICSEHRWIKHLVGGSGLLGLLSYTTYSKKSLNKWTPGANDCSGPLVAHDALALGSGELFNQTSITATSLVSKTVIQSEIPSKSVALAPSCLAP